MFEIDSISISVVRREELMQGLRLRPNRLGMLNVSSNCNFRGKNEDSFFSNDCECMTPFTPNSQIGSKWQSIFGHIENKYLALGFYNIF